MSTTNRVANRLVLLLAGLVLLALGGAMIAARVPATAADAQTLVGAGRDQLQTLVETAGSTTVHAVAAAVTGVLALLAVVLLLSRGGGRTSTAHVDAVSSDGPGPAGQVALTASFVQELLRGALTGRPEISAVSVDAWRHRTQTAWRIRVRPRSGVSPRAVVDLVAEQVRDLDDQLGTQVPVLVELVGSGRGRRDRADQLT